MCSFSMCATRMVPGPYRYFLWSPFTRGASVPKETEIVPSPGISWSRFISGYKNLLMRRKYSWREMVYSINFSILGKSFATRTEQTAVHLDATILYPSPPVISPHWNVDGPRASDDGNWSCLSSASTAVIAKIALRPWSGYPEWEGIPSLTRSKTKWPSGRSLVDYQLAQQRQLPPRTTSSHLQ